jgi:inorganic pyrophosphatase
MRQIVTSGSAFLDIDAYGAIVAYTELLQKQGQEALGVSSAPLNESITPEIRSWNAPLAVTYEPADDDTFTLVDISEPAFFDPIVAIDRVTRIIDHHPGLEQRWASLGCNAIIEFIGAACTLVYEQWQQANKLDEMSVVSARVLACGILDNTLNFKATVSTDRDRAAYDDLVKRAQFDSEYWAADYFLQCQAAIEADVVTAIRNDTKTMPTHEYLPRAFGQLVVWNAQAILADHRNEIADTLAAMDEDWVANIISIEEGKSYFIADNQSRQKKFGELMNLDLSSGIATADRLWLRKEVLKRSQEK